MRSHWGEAIVATDPDLTVPMATIQRSDGAGASWRFATHSAVVPRAADGCIARMMRKRTGTRLTSDAALLLL